MSVEILKKWQNNLRNVLCEYFISYLENDKFEGDLHINTINTKEHIGLSFNLRRHNWKSLKTYPHIT